MPNTEKLQAAIEVLRQNMGAADCKTCKRRWKVFMGVLAICVEEVGQKPNDDFLRIIGYEYERGHAKTTK